MSARFEVIRTEAGFHVRLVADNGEPLMSSEVYTRKTAAYELVDVVRALAGRERLPVEEVDVRGDGAAS